MSTETRTGAPETEELVPDATEVSTNGIEPTHVETAAPPDSDPFPDQEGSTPDWFKTAVFYEVLVLSLIHI